MMKIIFTDVLMVLVIYFSKKPSVVPSV